jgi:hypothetical protein
MVWRAAIARVRGINLLGDFYKIYSKYGMSLSSAKIRDHAVIEQIRAAGPPRSPELPSYWPSGLLIGLVLGRGLFGPGEKWRVSA